MTEEELAESEAVAKTYQRHMNARARTHQRDLSHKVLMKWLAISALPTKQLQLEAVTVTHAEMPVVIRPPTETPPHAGWQRPREAVVEAAAEDELLSDDYESEGWSDDEDTTTAASTR